MKLSATSLFCLWAGLTVGNFAYQFFNKNLWELALERSFFQLVALILVFIMFKPK